MRTHLKLEGHYIEHVPGGISVGAVATTVTLNGDLVVELPALFLPIGNGLAITPVVVPDGDTAVRIDFTRWSPLRYGTRDTARFPLNLTGQDLAVRVARAFDADPRTSWHCTAEEAMQWLRQHGDHLGLADALRTEARR